jgi:hypothetical protein
MIWFNIFSGFSARAIRSLMLDRKRVESRPDAFHVAGRRHHDALEGCLEPGKVEVLKMERLGENQLVFLQAVRPVDHVVGVQLQQGPEELFAVSRPPVQIHDLQSKHQERGRVIHDERQPLRAAVNQVDALGDLLVLRVHPYEVALQILTGHHVPSVGWGGRSAADC